ncbi:MAG: family 43 glycosylhydrolase, partial [Duncaniella sp.]|nr:family 43 glycosylhydrolase [Duncaniella sp.]
MKKSYIIALACSFGIFMSCSDDDVKTEVYDNPYTNPLTTYSAADPTVWKEGNKFYLFATNTSKIKTSTDMVTWSDGNNMFTKKPTFVTESGAAVWAPDIEKVGDK